MPEIADSNVASGNEPVLQTVDLSVHFGSRPALAEVSMLLRPGQLHVLLGPNGSGKSTLIRALLGDVASTGSIQWFGRPMAKWTVRELARRVAYLPQSPQWQPGQRVIDVLRLGRAPYWSLLGIESVEDESIALAVAEQLHLTDLLNRELDQLSGGQRQRVFIGRCLVQQATVLLLDEPNTYLDLRHQIELCRLLKALTAAKSLTVLMSLHDLNLAAAFADQVLLLQQGKLRSHGTVDSLSTELLGEVYQVPMSRLTTAAGTPVFVPMIS